LGTNSLVDLVVFGRRAGRRMLQDIEDRDWEPLPDNPTDRAREQIDTLLGRESGERMADIRASMQEIMMDKVSVVRNEQGMKEAKSKIHELKGAYENAAIMDRGTVFNMDL